MFKYHKILQMSYQFSGGLHRAFFETYTLSVKIVRIRSYSGPYFPAFGLNTERCGVSLRIQSECGKMGTRRSPNTDTFYAVILGLGF